jgi:hypothetical protein
VTDDLGPEPWQHDDVPVGLNARRVYEYATSVGGRRRRRRRQRRRAALAAAVAVVIIPVVVLARRPSTEDTTSVRGSGSSTTSSAPEITCEPTGMTSACLPSGEQNRQYNFTIELSGGTAPYSWSAAGLPAGLTINAGTGVISGTPTAAGTSTVTVIIKDSFGATASKTYSLVIAPPLSISGPASLPHATINRDYPGTPITATNGVAPFTWSATGFPTGVTIDRSGVITGRPNATGTFKVVITATDAQGGVDAHDYTLIVDSAP